MPYPTPIVEIAFTDGPYVVSPTWTDVTSYVRSMDISRGVPDDWTLQADGSATVVLSNRDRRFDPFNASGPYFGNLLPRRQIRIRATSGATTYDVFRGFISGWPPEWTDAGYDSTVTLSCFDALQLLGSSSLPADWSRQYILSLNPRHYYVCDEPVVPFGNATPIFDYGTVPNPMFTNTGTSGPQLAEGLVNKSISFMGVGSGAQSVSLAPSPASDFTVSFWSILGYGAATGYTGITEWGIGYNLVINKFAVVVTDSGTSRRWVPTSDIDMSIPHFYAFTYNSTAKTIQLYIDGALLSTTVTSSVAGNSTADQVSIVYGQFQQVCVWTSALSQATLRNIFNYSKAIFDETTSARVARIIAETPFSTSLVSTPASPASSVLDITDDAPTAAHELGRVADSEYAPLFVNKSGVLTLFQQNQIRTQTKSQVSQVTYGAGGLPISTEIQLQYDGDSMRNTANIQMSGGGVYIQSTSTSVSTYGEAEQYVSTQVASLADAQDIANIVTNWGGNVYAKASPVQVVLSPNESWGSTLGLELFDRFTLAVAPRTGSTITTPMLLSRISHSVTPERWSTTVEGSARWAAVFILNTSTLGGTDLLG